MGIALGFGWLGVHTAGLWEVAAGMYIVGSKLACLCGVPF